MNEPIVVLTGPSGSGKTTLCNYLVENYGFTKPKTCTTRTPRAEETLDSYFFMNRGGFEQKIQNNEMIEYVESFGNYYGCQVSALNRNQKIVIALNDKGAQKIKCVYPERVVVIMLSISRDTMLSRIQERSFMPNDQIIARLEEFECEYDHDMYDHVINSNQSITVVRNTVDKILSQYGTF